MYALRYHTIAQISAYFMKYWLREIKIIVLTGCGLLAPHYIYMQGQGTQQK